MCVLGEPTEQKIVLGHYGSLWMRISTSGPFIHTAFSEGKRDQTSIVRMRDVLDAVLEFAPEWEERTSYGGKRGIVNVGAINGGFAWRVSRTPAPHRPLRRLPRPADDVDGGRARRARRLRARAARAVSRITGSSPRSTSPRPGSEIAEDHPLVGAIDEAHTEVFGEKPERDTVRWFSDASTLTRYGIESVNYGTSSGLPDPELGENLDIDGLVKIATVYTRCRAADLRGRMKSLDAYLPSYEFSTRHEITVDAPMPNVADRALREVTFADVPIVRGLLFARGEGLRRGDEPVVATMVPSATVVEDAPGEGIVLSVTGQFWRLRGRGGPEPPATAVVDFRSAPGRLSTETRVHVARSGLSPEVRALLAGGPPVQRRDPHVRRCGAAKRRAEAAA